MVLQRGVVASSRETKYFGSGLSGLGMIRRNKQDGTYRAQRQKDDSNTNY
jgi:hypothetical protein